MASGNSRPITPRRKGKRLPLPDLGQGFVQPVRVQREGGPNAIMRGGWRDPDDTSPTAAKYARQISGWMTYCPLQRMKESGKGANITQAHINAATMLRLCADAAGIGFSSEKDDLPVTSILYGPKPGPSKIAQASEKAARAFKHATRDFSEEQLLMVEGIILRNWSIDRWCAMGEERTGKKMHAKYEARKLVEILDKLVEFYKTDIEEAIQRDNLPNCV